MLLQAATTTSTEMIGSPITAYLPVMIFFAAAVAFPVLPLVLGRFLRPIKYEKQKMRPYECGIDPTTEAHERFTVRYYIVAMLFLIFDVETIFLLPWAIVFMGDDFSFTKFALVEMLVFIAILVVGYYYAWRKGALYAGCAPVLGCGCGHGAAHEGHDELLGEAAVGSVHARGSRS